MDEATNVQITFCFIGVTKPIRSAALSHKQSLSISDAIIWASLITIAAASAIASSSVGKFRRMHALLTPTRDAPDGGAVNVFELRNLEFLGLHANIATSTGNFAHAFNKSFYGYDINGGMDGARYSRSEWLYTREWRPAPRVAARGPENGPKNRKTPEIRRLIWRDGRDSNPRPSA